jgi:hypothetical protein
MTRSARTVAGVGLCRPIRWCRRTRYWVGSKHALDTRRLSFDQGSATLRAVYATHMSHVKDKACIHKRPIIHDSDPQPSNLEWESSLPSPHLFLRVEHALYRVPIRGGWVRDTSPTRTSSPAGCRRELFPIGFPAGNCRTIFADRTTSARTETKRP